VSDLGIVGFLGLIGQLYAIMNPIGKLAIVGPLAVERPAYVRKITVTVVVVVYVLASLFAVAGGFILSAFGVSIDSFRIAGGIVLMAISIMTLVSGSYVGRLEITEEQAVVPLATPLIVGPGTITALDSDFVCLRPGHRATGRLGGVDCRCRDVAGGYKSREVRRRHSS